MKKNYTVKLIEYFLVQKTHNSVVTLDLLCFYPVAF